jgi:gliding motility-associated-like protein
MFLRDYSLKIFNRWGELLFESKDINNRWDGTYKGLAVSEGTYIYTLEAIGSDGRFHSHNGSLLLLR